MRRQVARVLRSFSFAWAGLGYLLRTQPNFSVHLVAAVTAVLVGVWLGVGGAELAVLALAIGMVLVAEALNTALEALVDLASPRYHPLAKVAKDVGAAAVLLAALTAVAVGVIVFLPRLGAAWPLVTGR